MLNSVQTRIGANTFHMPLDPAVVIDQEGAVLVAVQKAGVTYATLSKGEKNEAFIGFSTGQGSASTGEVPLYVNGTIPSGTDPTTGDALATQLMLHTDRIGRAALKIGGTDATIVNTAGDLGAGKAFFQDGYLRFDPSDAGKVVTGYAMVPRTGNTGIFGRTVGVDGNIAVIASGHISTDMFDPDADYNGTDGLPPALYTGPDGTLTTDTAGTLLPRLVVELTPEVNDGFLQVRDLG